MVYIFELEAERKWQGQRKIGETERGKR